MIKSLIPDMKFGTDGWRGVIADDFTVSAVRVATRAVGNYLLKSNVPGQGVVIGYDCRAMSELFAQTAAEVISSLGIPVLLSASPISSPALVWSLLNRKMQGGIMLTASHNPGTFHGIKFKPHYGGSASAEITTKIEAEIEELKTDYEKWTVKPQTDAPIETAALHSNYLIAMTKLIDMRALQNANLKVVFDAMHGAGSGYLTALLPEAVGIREERNPYFGGINPEPIEKNMQALFNACKAHNADVGISVDGDADRLGAADENGEFVDSHRIFAVLLKHLVEHRKLTGTVVKTVSTTNMIDKLCSHYQLPMTLTPIGFKYICDEMMKGDVLLGGEESGGIGFPKHLNERDGVFMGLLLLESVAVSGKSLSQLIQDVFSITGEHHYTREDLHFQRDEMSAVRAVLTTIQPDEIAEAKVKRIDRTDGIKFHFENGWLLLRASGTEPVVRVYSEADTREQAENWVSAGETLIRDAIGE